MPEPEGEMSMFQPGIAAPGDLAPNDNIIKLRDVLISKFPFGNSDILEKEISGISDAEYNNNDIVYSIWLGDVGEDNGFIIPINGNLPRAKSIELAKLKGYFEIEPGRGNGIILKMPAIGSLEHVITKGHIARKSQVRPGVSVKEQEHKPTKTEKPLEPEIKENVDVSDLSTQKISEYISLLWSSFSSSEDNTSVPVDVLLGLREKFQDDLTSRRGRDQNSGVSFVYISNKEGGSAFAIPNGITNSKLNNFFDIEGSGDSIQFMYPAILNNDGSVKTKGKVILQHTAKSAEIVCFDIVKRAEREYQSGNNGIAAVLLCRASQIMEDSGNMTYSAKLFAVAQGILNG
jgi:hypothetical protein